MKKRYLTFGVGFPTSVWEVMPEGSCFGQIIEQNGFFYFLNGRGHQLGRIGKLILQSAFRNPNSAIENHPNTTGPSWLMLDT